MPKTGLRKPRRFQLPVPTTGRCLNCDATLTGKYCAQCGQHVKHHVHSTRAVVAELVEDLFHTDHRVWHTLIPLLYRPGEVTVEYLRGKRASYTPPFRLYLVLSLLFFLTNSLNPTEVVVAPASNPAAAVHALDPAAKEKLDAFIERLDAEKRPEARRRLEGVLREIPTNKQVHVVEGMANPCSVNALSEALPESMLGREQLLDVCRKATGETSADLERAITEHVPQMMFFLLPLLALFGKLLYIGSRRYYAEHLLFFVHFHAFFFLIAAINNVLGWLVQTIGGSLADYASGLMTTAMVIYIPIYLYRAMRRVYAQRRWVTVMKFTLLMGAYFWCVLLTFAGLAAITAMILK